jgi:outer membrane protein TolC
MHVLRCIAFAALLCLMPMPLPAATMPYPFSTFRELSPATAQSSALLASPDLAAARARTLQAAAAYSQARDATAPSFIAGYTEAPQGNPPGSTIRSRFASAGLRITLAELLSAPPQIRAAALQFASAQAEEDSATAIERSKAVALYFDALSACAVATARDAALGLATAQAAEAKTRWKAGDAPRLDTVRAAVAVARTEADLAIARANAENALESLRVESGFPATSSLTVILANPTAAPPTPSLETAVTLADRLRPELRAARLASQAATASIRAARTAGAPDVTLDSSYGAGLDSGTPIAGPSINLQMQLPLSSVGRDRVRAAEAQALEAEAKLRAVERRVELDVTSSARLLTAAIRSEESAQSAARLALDEFNATFIGYRHGATPSLEVEAARTTYIQSEIDSITASYARQKLQAQFEIGIGR